ncbi:MAG: hypothetical protein ACE5FU_01770 [Nitrospinota bacterium]
MTIHSSGLVEVNNPSATRIFAFEAEEVIGKNVKMLMPSPIKKSTMQYYPLSGNQ